MSVTKEFIREYNGNNVYSFVLSNNNGLSAEILNYGGIIKKLIYKNTDVCLGFDTFEEYLNNNDYFGAIIGRNTNRILDSELTINKETYILVNNSGKDNHHGGKIGFDKKVWEPEIIDGNEPSLVLSTVSIDREEGFPGNVSVKVTYTLTNDNSLRIHYEAESDADTVLNMTNHTYFNLNGHNSGSVSNHSLWLSCDFYTPNGDREVPNGEILSVKGTPFDFTDERVIINSIKSENAQIRKAGGLDHNFIINGNAYRKAGIIKADKSDITMEIYTDREGMQIYTANEIGGNKLCKENTLYTKHCGICFETQAFPGNLKFSHFPTAVLKKGQRYESVTSYKFI